MRQVLGYSMYLKTPPLLVASAFNVIRIRTNFPGMESVQRHTVRIADLAEPQSPALALLKRVFTDPESFQHRQEPRRRYQRNRRPVPGRQQRHGRRRLRR